MSCARYLSVAKLTKREADSLVKCLGTASELMGIKIIKQIRNFWC